ncbi:hypothetical protein Bca101_048322 [Brassica carinata]
MDPPPLPKRLFAFNEEPNGDRVNTYHKIKRTAEIIEALDPEEIDFLHNSTFGKIISNYDNPPFSGAFGYSVIVCRLKTKNRYEIWFLFAGNPIRFFLREFAIVTGLNYGPLPNQKRRKRKNPLNEKLYWHKLFGSLKSCIIEIVIEMLKKRVVKDKETRIKFACLAITSSVLLPTSHYPKIIPEHVELIRGLQDFLNYPWGRVSFNLLISNLIKKDEIALSQDSVAIQGYVDTIQLVTIAAVKHAWRCHYMYGLKTMEIPLQGTSMHGWLRSQDNGDVTTRDKHAWWVKDSVAIQGYVDTIQLVMIAAVPSLKEEVVPPEPVPVVDYGSETENATEEEGGSEEQAPGVVNNNALFKFVVIPGHARNNDGDGKVKVSNIIDAPMEEWLSDTDFTSPDEIEDAEVKEKDHNTAESGEAESPDNNSNIPFATIVGDQLKDHLGGIELRLRQAMVSEIQGLEVKVRDAVMETAPPPPTPFAPVNPTIPSRGENPSSFTDNVGSSAADATIRDVLGDLEKGHQTDVGKGTQGKGLERQD